MGVRSARARWNTTFLRRAFVPPLRRRRMEARRWSLPAHPRKTLRGAMSKDKKPYAMTAPCESCPFRREGGIRLTAGRIREIGGMMLDSQGGTFHCHKTTEHDDDNDEYIPTGNEIECAGALIFAEKNGNQTQMMRIAGRLGLYNPDSMQDKDSVFDTLAEMLATAVDRRRRGRKR
jgi:hypothetical protein